MSSIDLTEAIQAAAEGFCADLVPPTTLRDLSGIQQHVIREQALSYVTHAAPLIEAAVREQVQMHALRVLREHTIECTSLGAVTCRACRDRGWISWSEYHTHMAEIIARGEQP